jgi:LPXTG-motif cell wall-anchored protein
MKHRGLARLAVAAGAVLAGAVMAANPAAATVPDDGGGGVAILDIPKPPPLLTAKDFLEKKLAAASCDGIKDGAKQGTDGWVFDQPAQGAANFIYVFGFADADSKPVVLGLDNEGGIVNFDLSKLPPDAARLQAGKIDDSQAKSLAKAAASTDKDLAKVAGGEGDASPGLPSTIDLPAGVAGGLAGTEGVWLQTPAGWHLVFGEMIHDKPGADAPKKFHLVRVCEPKAATPPVAAPAPGAGGGNGQSLPVTGTNVAVLTGAGVLLVGVGAGLFVMRRRRETTKFVA